MLSKLTPDQLAEEALDLARAFGERVRDGTARSTKGERYAIERPLRPDCQFWPPTVSAPQFVSFNARDLTQQLKEGAPIPGLAQIRRDFDNIRFGFVILDRELDAKKSWERPDYAGDAQRNIREFLPDIENFIAAADRKLGMGT